VTSLAKVSQQPSNRLCSNAVAQRPRKRCSGPYRRSPRCCCIAATGSAGSAGAALAQPWSITEMEQKPISLRFTPASPPAYALPASVAALSCPRECLTQGMSAMGRKRTLAAAGRLRARSLLSSRRHGRKSACPSAAIVQPQSARRCGAPPIRHGCGKRAAA
jgi:hypothetical protein